MKALSVLLLLALGLGSAWWRITHPSGTLEDARREANALGTRLEGTALAARDGALAALARVTGSDTAEGPDDPAPEPADATDPGEPAAATLAARTDEAGRGAASVEAAGEGGPDAPLDIDPSLDPLAAVSGPATGSDDVSAAVTTRLSALEEQLSETPTASAANVVQGRLTDAERRLDAIANRENATLERLEAIDGRLGRIAERLEASAIESNRRQDDATARLDGIDSTLAALARRGDVLANRLDTLGADRLAAADEPPAGPDGSGADVGGERDVAAAASAPSERDAGGPTIDGDGETADVEGDEGPDADANSGAGTDAGADPDTDADADADTDAEPADGTTADPEGDIDVDAATDGATDGDAGDEVADGEEPDGRTAPAAASPTAARLDAMAAAVDRRLAAMETLLASTSSTAAEPATDRLEALARRVDALAAARAVPPQANGAAVDAAQAELRTELTAIDEQVGDEDAPALDRALESTRERLGALEARVRALPAASDAADEAKATQEALEEQLRALERRIETLPPNTDPALASSIDEVRDQVDALANRGFVTQEELREAEERSNEYKIYFDRNSTTISEAAARVLDSFIAQEKNRTTGVSIFGFTDRQGSASYNQRLALERATIVRSYLIQNGLPYDKVRTLNGLGEDAAAAILPDEAEDAQQRVVVIYAAQP